MATSTKFKGIAELRTRKGVSQAVAESMGYNSPNDGGKASYWWDNTTTAADDGGSTLRVPGVSAGAWRLNYDHLIFVAKFGAKGDGITDDTAAIQKAANFAAANNCAIAFRKDTYVVSALTFNANLRVIGGDATLKQVRANTTAVPILNLGDSNHISALKLICQPEANQDVGNGAIYASQKKDVVVENCAVRNHAMFGIQLDRCKNVKITGNDFWTDFKMANLRTGTGERWPNSSDIYMYSSQGTQPDFGEGVDISGNWCRSPFTSQGIWINGQGCDRRSFVQRNYCVVSKEDKSEWTDRTYWLEVGTGFTRRHGINLSYYSATDSGALVCSGNICAVSNVTGIYVSGEGEGQGVVVSGNYCSENGYATTSDVSLSGNISITGGTGLSHVSGNFCANFKGTHPNSGAINIQKSTSYTGKHFVRLYGNEIVNSAGNGIRIQNAADSVVITGGSIIDSAAHDFYYDNNVGTSNVENWVRLQNVDIVRTNKTKRSIYIDTPDKKRISLSNVSIRGVDAATVGDENTAVFVQNSKSTLLIKTCSFSNFYRGIYFYGDTKGRRNEVVVQNCDFEDLGVAVQANSMFPYQGLIVGQNNRYRNVTNFTDYGYNQAYFEGQVNFDNSIVIRGAVPTTGTWQRGDQIISDFPNAGGVFGTVCVTSGTFGLLSGVTGSVAAGGTILTVNNASALAVGMFISIAGVGANRIAAVSGLLLTLQTPAASAASGAAISFVAPVLKTISTIQA